MSLIRYNPSLTPISTLSRLQGDLLRAFESPVRVDDALRATADEAGYSVRLEIPGTPPEDIVVETRAGVLTIAVQSEAPASAASGPENAEPQKHVRFSRSIRLPNDADLERVGARYLHGVLTVEIPKKEAAKPRVIEVQVS